MSKKQRVVVALGGNAFTGGHAHPTMAGQFEFAREALEALLPVFEADYEVLLSHGNGPQVGYMLIRVERALGAAYPLPLEVCVAESEGELGYVLQQTLHNLLIEVGRPRPVVSVLTQVVVDPDDPAFETPTKPIGPFYDAARAAILKAEGLAVVEDSGRGYRRVVPSPKPKEVIEEAILERLLDDGVVVIAAGGGGIPVVRKQGKLQGVAAVIDKDLSSALLADNLGAQRLIMITQTPCAYTDFATPAQAPIGRIDRVQAQRLVEAGHFSEGSMKPKIEAAISFVHAPGREAIICAPNSLAAAMAGQAGTRIVSVGL